MKRPAAFVEEEVQVSWWPAFEGRLVAWIDADCPTVSLPDGESAGSESASSSAAPEGTVQCKVLVGKVPSASSADPVTLHFLIPTPDIYIYI